MTSTTPHTPEHLLRRGAAKADPANPALRTVPAPSNTALIPTIPRDAVINGSTLDLWNQLPEQESFVMRISPFTAAKAVSNRSARSGLANHHLPNSAACIGDCQPAPWPSNPDDVSPLQYWRTMPAEHLGEAQQKMLRFAIKDICVLKNRTWLVDVPDDAAVGIALALGILPITTITLEVDLAMSALTVSALGGNAASALVLAHILRLAPLDHPFAGELSVSWLALNLRRSRETKGSATRPAIANLHQSDHQTAFHVGGIA